VPYKWANQTWFYPEREISEYELMEGLRLYYPILNSVWTASGKALTVAGFQDLMKEIKKEISFEQINILLKQKDLTPVSGEDAVLNRRYTSVLLDAHLALFEKEIDHSGNLK
jgi:hypothetical protein